MSAQERWEAQILVDEVSGKRSGQGNGYGRIEKKEKKRCQRRKSERG
jgi:hypothetical protein